MPKQHIVKYPIGQTHMIDTLGPFTIIDNKSLSDTKKLWEEKGKTSIPHDQGYKIRLKCGYEHWTLCTQIKKCIDPNPSDPPAHGWKDCYKCNGIFNPETCTVIKKENHTIKKEPERDVEIKPGTIYNELKVIDFAFNAKRHRYWEFECIKCGEHIFRMTPTNQNDIDNCHCPYCRDKIQSKGETRIAQYLQIYNKKYQTQYIFEDCIHIKPLPFDFAIFDPSGNLKCVIEYDGEQHYKFVKIFHGDEEGFELQKKRDKIKTDYCKKHNIKLIRIPYTEFDNIEQILKDNLII